MIATQTMPLDVEVVECSHDEYHADGANSVSRSELDVFIESPEAYYRQFIAKTFKPKKTKALDLGTVFHDLVLGIPHEIDAGNFARRTMAIFERCAPPDRTPDQTSDSGSRYWFEGDTLVRESDHWGRVGSCYWSHPDEIGVRCGRVRFARMLFDDGVFVPIPSDVLSAIGSRAGGAWDKFKSQHDGRILLKDAEWGPMMEWWECLVEHPKANNILFRSDGLNEYTIRWTCPVTGLRRRVRLDRVIPTVLIGDVKTARSVDPGEFSRNAFGDGYHRQNAFYQDGAEAECGVRLPMLYLAVEKVTANADWAGGGIGHGVPRCEVMELDEQFVEIGRWEINVALQRLAHCRKTGVWKSPTHGKVIKIEAPGYAINQYQNRIRGN